ncbi:CPBP family intramembrane glutamic endopeptidase [Methanobrevibacter sp.]|uniref:CPBP family intramembrane glutamic endopeptidase n=1 Tax=Methanobrevibacter sp. TaxID=66852 RepID=UPI00388F146E
MDFSVKDFNVRLRTITLLEAGIAIVICLFLAGYIYNFIGFENEEFSSMIFDLCIMGFFALACIGTRGFTKDVNKVFEFGNAFKIVALAVIDFLFCTVLINLCVNVGLVFTVHAPSFLNAAGPGFTDPLTLFLGFIVAVFIAPIAEELLFRGVIFNRLKIRKGAPFAIVVSSIIFGSLHFYGGAPFLHVITATTFGMLMCVFYMKYDNILMNIAVHFLGNLLVYINDYTPLLSILYHEPFAEVMGLLCLFSVIFVPVYIIYYARKFNKPVF